MWAVFDVKHTWHLALLITLLM